MSDGGPDLPDVLQNATTPAAGPASGYLNTFGEMWYQMFLWALFSSLFVHALAAAIAFATLRKHRFGKFFPVFILVMGVLPPLTSGVVSCAVVALVYKASNIVMAPLYALFWGVGQTVVAACVGFTRILATL
ncbi:transmembrane protein 170A [Bacillus rossius redtenbacheri]|uniref:transmembrane protein 170A n=1 Tax=Bacillus rossius redtenbacheri TaxID=93214 RepID=UPI002FDDCB9D